MPPRNKREHSEPTKSAASPEAPARAQTSAGAPPPYASIFESMPQAIAMWRLVYDPKKNPVDLEIVAANKAFRDTFDLPDAVGQRLDEVDPGYGERSPDILGIAARVSATGAMETAEVHHPGLDRWFGFSAASVPGGLVMTFSEDITDRKRAESALRRVQDSFDRLEDFPAWSDANGRIVDIGEAACRQLGYTREELLAMTVFDLTPGLDREAWVRSWREIKPPDFFRTEVEHRTKSGTTYPAEITVHPMVFDGHEYHCTFSRDITDRKKAEADVRRLRYSLDQMNDYPTWNDSDGRIIEVSESTTRHLLYSRDELLNMTIFDICPDLDKQKWTKSWETTPVQSTFRVQVHHRAKDGRIFPVEITVNPMIFDDKRYHCTFCRDISDRKELEDTLQLTKTSVDTALDMVHWIDTDGNIIYANRSMCDLLGYEPDELEGAKIWTIDPEVTPELLKQRWDRSRDGGMLFEETWQTRDGRRVAVEIAVTNIRHDDRDMAVAFARDITDRKLAEISLKESEERYRLLWEEQTDTLKALKERDEQLLQAQKMEAIGRLAGGIAHDFNNVLTTIIGYSDLLLSSPELPEGSVTEDITEIREAAQRAGALTQRILAFSRRQAMQPKVLSLGDVVSDIERLLARTIGADIELKTSLSPDLVEVEADEHQLVQVLLNLAVNARDAMPDGGTLTLAAENVELDEQFCEVRPEMQPGPHAKLTVTDTGSGMDEEVLSHVFEPFYTTKPPGLGTGLGLATVYGVVTQSGGCVEATSEPGRGTTIAIYLPRAGAAIRPSDTSRRVAEVAHQLRTVVVVDSDAPFRTLATRILQRRGLKALAFEDGEQAVKILADPAARLDALVTDTFLSGTMQGSEVASIATEVHPQLPVLFLTAQASDVPEAGAAGTAQAATLEKPFTAEELTGWVQTWLTETGPVDHPDQVRGE